MYSRFLFDLFLWEMRIVGFIVIKFDHSILKISNNNWLCIIEKYFKFTKMYPKLLYCKLYKIFNYLELI